MSAENSPQSDPDAPLRDRLADAVAAEAAFDGWSRTALSAASRQLALPAGEADRLFPGGPVQILTLGKVNEIFHSDWTVRDRRLAAAIGFRARYGLSSGFGDTILWYRRHGWL